MKKTDSFPKKLKKISIVFLVITLILGILSSGFGICVAAMNRETTPSANDAAQPQNEQPATQPTTSFVAPTQEYEDLNNEAAMSDEVVVLTDAQSQQINSSIVKVETVETYYEERMEITLSGEEQPALSGVSYHDIIYLQGDESTPFGGDRILRVEGISSYTGQTIVSVSEPYFEDVFESLEVCSSTSLTQENFVSAYYAEGVTAHFGNVESEMMGVSKTEDLGNAAVQTLAMSTTQQVQPIQTAADNVNKLGDLIVEIDYDFNKNAKEDKNAKDKETGIDASYGIKGEFGIRDLAAHLVCDMPRAADFEELYLGLSGETFVDIDVYGKVSAAAEMEASKKDTFLFSFEGLNEKRFPIAVFQFKGTTPVYITHSQFENKKDSILPTLYLILYADWEGKISLEINGGFEYAHGFNNGLRVFKEGEPCLSFENYPYESAYHVDSEDGFVWEANLQLEADTDLTLFGGSVLFYVAGVNLGEISAARLGVEAQCNVSITANSKEGLQVANAKDTEFYIRGYLKLIEAKVKLKAEGKSFLSKLSIDVNFEFALLDLTLFEKGAQPGKYKPKVPISSMEAPTSFESVITLVCDVSGSMDATIDSGQTKLAAAKESAKMIVSTTQDWADGYEGNYGIGLVMFSDYAETVALPHIDYKYINECIDTMGDGGGTSVHSGIDTGVSQLTAVTSANKVMILMTDGQDSNDSATLESAQAAADANIKIFTIGFGNDVNEEVLKEIADITGGEYRFASTDNIVGIMGSFMYAQQASTAEVLTEIEDTVGEGEISEATQFVVSDKSGKLMTSTAWPGSFLDTILVDPNGRVVDENYPNAVTDESKIPSTITVNDPIQGEWSVSVKGIETSYEQEPFYTIVSFRETENAKINDSMSTLEQIAAYCIPIGLFTTLVSAMLLLCFIQKRKDEE